MDAKTWFSMTREQKIAYIRQQMSPERLKRETPESHLSYYDAWFKQNQGK